MNGDIVWEIIAAAIGIAGTLFAIGSVIFTVKHTNRKDDTLEGREKGQLFSDIGYIKSSVDDIKKKQSEQDKQYIKIALEVNSVSEGLANITKRVERLEKALYDDGK